MDRSLYIAMNGAKQIMQAQAANSNNLANANTTAFRSDFEQFRSQPVFGPGMPTRVYSMNERPGVNFSAGSAQSTGRDLDVAVDGDGWIAVNGLDRKEAFTRAGNMQITQQGQLVTDGGLPVIGNNGPISLPPAEKIDIAGDGTISVLPPGGGTAMAIVDRIKLIRLPKEQLEKGDDGLMRQKDTKAPPAQASPDVKLASGFLEGSNVSAVSEMVSMIELQRQYETQIKMMKTTEDIGASSAQLMRVG